MAADFKLRHYRELDLIDGIDVSWLYKPQHGRPLCSLWSTGRFSFMLRLVPILFTKPHRDIAEQLALIPCAVLSDGTRLLTQAGFLAALGRSTKPKGRSQQVTDGLPPFLATKSLTGLINKEIIDTTVPIAFVTPTGGRAQGFRAELLPKVCDLFLQARADGVLTAQQLPIAEKCEMLVRALAKVGIVALVDEATGFQHDRDRDALVVSQFKTAAAAFR